MASRFPLQQREHCFGEPRQVPEGDARLVGVCVASILVDGAEYRGRIVCLHEGAWAVVDGFAGDRGVVSIHDAMDESNEHPLRDQVSLAGDYSVKESAKWIFSLRDLRIVASDCVVREGAQGVCIAAGGEKLECADPEVARCYAREYCAGQD